MAYSTGDVLVRAEMEAYSGLLEDRVMNDFAFKLDGGVVNSTTIAAAFDAVDDFYRVATSTGNAVGKFISRFVNRSATHSLKMYAISAGPLGSPIANIDWLGPVTPAETTGLPTEVAGVLSFHADTTNVLEESGATRPAARRRGRIFVGPLIPGAMDMTAPPFMLSESTFLQTLRAAAVTLMDRTDVTWCVWSRADAVLRPVVGGWTDNAPDTQRRRGADATARVTWG